jgi:F-type H+-transporting ATPase subunit epsilon
MITSKLYLEVVTPQKQLFSGEVRSIDVPSVSGRFTILQDHAPIIAALKEGVITVEGRFSEEHSFNCTSGLIECSDNHVNILLVS